VTSVQFGILSPDEVLKMSVADICSEVPYDEHGNPRFNGVNDPRLGVCSRDYRCVTCKGTSDECPGHFGHIELARKVYHANLLPYTLKVLRSICFNCSKLLVAADKSQPEYKFLVSCKSSKSRFNYCYTQSTNKQGRVCDPKFGGCGYR
jgi:DNA-directed RNA polymerase II subunit RPB1